MISCVKLLFAVFTVLGHVRIIQLFCKQNDFGSFCYFIYLILQCEEKIIVGIMNRCALRSLHGCQHWKMQCCFYAVLIDRCIRVCFVQRFVCVCTVYRVVWAPFSHIHFWRVDNRLFSTEISCKFISFSPSQMHTHTTKTTTQFTLNVVRWLFAWELMTSLNDNKCARYTCRHIALLSILLNAIGSNAFTYLEQTT